MSLRVSVGGMCSDYLLTTEAPLPQALCPSTGLPCTISPPISAVSFSLQNSIDWQVSVMSGRVEVPVSGC